MEKTTERPLLSRANTGSSLAKYLSVLVLAFPHLKKPPPRGQKKCLRIDRPTPQTDRHRLVRERERGDGHVRVKRRRAVTAGILLRDACLEGKRARAQAPVPWLMGAAFGARNPIAEFMRRLRETALEARFPSPSSGHGRGEHRWKRAFSPSKKKKKKEIIWLEETTLEALVPATGTTP